MESLAVFSRSKEFLDLVPGLLPPALAAKANLHRLGPERNILEFLRFEIPELVILHADSVNDNFVPLFKALEDDPWLESINFVLLVPDVERALEQYRGYNVTYFLHWAGVERNLGRVLSILTANKDHLTNVDLVKKLTALTGEITVETDILLVQYYSSFFANYLYKEGYVNAAKKFAVHLVLTELLFNAMEHGNAGISYQEKTEFLSWNSSLQDLVDQRMRKQPWAGRKVTVGYSISPVKSVFTITDEGEGFNTKLIPTKAGIGKLQDSHGRGIFLSINSSDRLEFNAKGNSVTVEFYHNTGAERLVPPGFLVVEPKVWEAGQQIFAENEVGDSLYYIVSGEYTVYIKGKKITTLTPGDIFLGEMSFLLGNRRSATVVASRTGKLVEIGRDAFTEAVKKYPNYAIFLSKLLARRLREANLRYVSTQDMAFGG